MRYILFTVILGLSACGANEATSIYDTSDQLWVLESIDNTPFPARATLSFPSKSEVRGEGPCNSFSGLQNAPYPWFEFSDISATRSLCENSTLEEKYFKELQNMELIEILDSSMVLKTASGRKMLFRAAAYP